MQKYLPFSIFICLLSCTFVVKSQGQTPARPLTVTPSISLQQLDWNENSTIGKAGVELKFSPFKKKINITLNVEGMKSLGTSSKSLATASLPNAVFDNKAAIPVIPTPPNVSTVGTASTPSETMLRGGVANIDIGVPFRLKDSTTTIEPFIGLDGKIWTRSITLGQDNQTTLEEKYKFISPTFGGKISYQTKSKVKLTLRLSGSYPIIAKVRTDTKNLSAPSTEIDLGKQLSPSIEVGAKVKKITIKVRYERINIGNSDSLRGQIVQPASRANITGITVGYEF